MRLAFAIALLLAAANHPTDAGHEFRGYTAAERGHGERMGA